MSNFIGFFSTRLYYLFRRLSHLCMHIWVDNFFRIAINIQIRRIILKDSKNKKIVVFKQRWHSAFSRVHFLWQQVLHSSYGYNKKRWIRKYYHVIIGVLRIYKLEIHIINYCSCWYSHWYCKNVNIFFDHEPSNTRAQTWAQQWNG